MCIIQADGLGKKYKIYERPIDRLKEMITKKKLHKDFWALRDISFELSRGESLGIIGKNGSGKSTLLQLLCGILEPTEGYINANGRIAALLELGSGFNGEFKGIDNVFLNASILGLKKEQIEERLDSILAFADIGDFVNEPVKTYSSGMALRLAFSVIAHVDADILVIDEALAVGDIFFVQKCMRFIKGFREKGTLVLVTHDPNSVLVNCTHGLTLKDGRVFTKKVKSIKAIEIYTKDYYSELNKSESEGVTDKSDEIMENIPKETQFQARTNMVKRKDESLETIIRQAFYEQKSVVTPLRLLENEGTRFGTGECEIIDIKIRNIDEKYERLILSGERVFIEISATAHQAIADPIIGFQIKNRYGVEIIGSNTYDTYSPISLKAEKGQCIRARFEFTLPFIRLGTYTVHAAIARGSLDDHVQMDYYSSIAKFEVFTQRQVHAEICPHDMIEKIYVTPHAPYNEKY